MVKLGDKWRVRRLDPNSLTLDYCRFRSQGAAWSRRIPVWKAQRELSGKHVGEGFSVEYRFDAAFGTASPRNIWLVLECPERYAVEVNSNRVPCSERGWWIDTSFRKIGILGCVRKGQNLVRISGVFAEDSEVENAYVVGDFAVEVSHARRFRLIDEAEYVESGDLVARGYPFFAGTISLTQEFRLRELLDAPYWLELEGLRAAVTSISVNGRKQGTLCWGSGRMMVRGLCEGRNVLEVRLTNTLRNLLGPHHHKAGDPLSVGPRTFSDEENWVDDYSFVPNGFTAAWIYPDIERHAGAIDARPSGSTR